MTNRQPTFLSLTFVAALAAAGCDAGLETGSRTDALESENALSMNALSMNALSMNALSMNALSMNALSMNGLADSPEGLHVTKYIVRCALDAGSTFEYDGDEEADLPGLLGLAPDWEGEALSAAESETISACLLAHVNHFGISVNISARHPDLPASADELNRFSVFEGAFFGQLFADPPALYACTGDASPDFAVSYPNHDTDAGDRLLRRCTDSGTCGFTNVGSCATACTHLGDGNYGDCYSGPGQTGLLYGDAMSIWLLEHDDSASTWPSAYDSAYGN